MAEPPVLESDPAAVRRFVRQRQSAGLRVGFVPTMGALHAGHLALAIESAATCDATVVSIFVNPTQFGPGEDFERYPRDLHRDAQLLAGAKTSLVFAPSVETMYPAGAETTVEVGEIARRWEGEQRPGHFRGVATIVAKLLNIVPADVAFFGQKDFQQGCVVRRMMRDLDFETEIQILPTVREPDGLAMSSRNAYLDAQQRQRALCLYRGLAAAAAAADAGERSAERLAARLRAPIVDAAPMAIDYAAIVDRETLAPLDTVDRPAVALAAIRLGAVRLIDNMLLG